MAIPESEVSRTSSLEHTNSHQVAVLTFNVHVAVNTFGL